jgi:uncharacterized protein YcfJ
VGGAFVLGFFLPPRQAEAAIIAQHPSLARRLCHAMPCHLTDQAKKRECSAVTLIHQRPAVDVECLAGDMIAFG